MVVLLSLLITPLLSRKFEKEECLRIKFMLECGDLNESDLIPKIKKKLKKVGSKDEKI